MFSFYLKNWFHSAMLRIAKIASCRTLSPAAFQLRKLVAAGEIPDTPRALHRGCSFYSIFP